MRKQLMDQLTWLSQWYAKQCNGEWKHGYGVKIDTMDNPGWMLRINLEETELENRPFQGRQSGEVSEQYDPAQVESWWLCRVEKKQLVAYCGAHDLNAAISIFRECDSYRKLKRSPLRPAMAVLSHRSVGSSACTTQGHK
jgi:hypothetical protein